jgi:TPR repeat protein
MCQASPGQKSGQNARSCKMGPKHWLYHGPIFWVQVTILLATTELVSSCRSAAPSITAVRIIFTHQATQRQRQVAEKNALRVYRAFGQLERVPVITVDTKRDENSKGAKSVMNYDTESRAILGNTVSDLSGRPEPGAELKIGNSSSLYMGDGRASRQIRWQILRRLAARNAKYFFSQLPPLDKKLEPGKKNPKSILVRTTGSRETSLETSPTAYDVKMGYTLEGESLVESSARGVELPTFFPPRATDRFPIPVRLASDNATLQQLADRLSEALKDAGYEGKCSYYWLDDLHGPGFAIVTHIEHIQTDGKPILDQRWGFDLPRRGPLTLGSLLGALMHADPGRYRLIALVASRQPLIEKDTPMTPDQVVTLNEGPSWLGDSSWKTVVATADFHLIAYVYEFERKSRSDDPELMVSSDLTAEQHLQSTGLNDDIKKAFTNQGVGQDYLNETLHLFLSEAKLGDSYAMMQVGRLYLKRGTPDDDVEGFNWLNRAYHAPNRDLEAGAYVADCYLSGRGTKPDVQKAEEIIIPLANQNVVPAMTLAGRILQYKAENIHGQAAGSANRQMQKRLEAQANEMDRQARQWWERAAKKDDWNGAAHLGKCYEDGWGGFEKDEEQAEKLYQGGVEHGNPLSLLLYGLMIQGKPERRNEAVGMISRAAADGLPSAIKWCRDNHVPLPERKPDDESQ